MVCREREILREYFDKKNGSGFEFAYLYPGMNKVQQAAGRVIRTEKDRGIIALLDERFLNTSYQRVFPVEWKDFHVCTKDSVTEYMKSFWGEEPEDV
jgi:Rad3-related DNA helicase